MQKFNGSLIRQFPSLTTGNAASGVQVSVFISGTNTLATLYATNNTAGAQLDNPLTTDDKGFYSFYAVDGRYRLQFNNGFPSLEEQLVDVIDINAEVDAAIAEIDAALVGLGNTVDTLTIVVAGDFETGTTVTARNQVVLWPISAGGDGREYRWAGSLPKTVPAASTPASTGGISDSAWVYAADVAFEQALAAVDSAKLVGGVKAGVLASQIVNVKTFGAVGDGVTDDTAAIQAAIDYAVANQGTVFFPATPDHYSLRSVHPTHTSTFLYVAPTGFLNKVGFKGGAPQTKIQVDVDILGAVSLMLFDGGPGGVQSIDRRIEDLAFFGGPNSVSRWVDHCLLGKDGYHPNMTITACQFYGAAVSCIRLATYVTTMTNVRTAWAPIGFHLEGPSPADVITSITMNSCYGIDHDTNAYKFGYLTYSSLNACAADGIDGFAYEFFIVRGVTMNGCGSESSRQLIKVGSFFGFHVNTFMTLSIGDASSPPDTLIEFTRGSSATIRGIVNHVPRGFNKVFKLLTNEWGSECVEFPDSSVSPEDCEFAVSNFTFDEPLKFPIYEKTLRSRSWPVTNQAELVSTIATVLQDKDIVHDVIIQLPDGDLNITSPVAFFGGLTRGSGSVTFKGGVGSRLVVSGGGKVDFQRTPASLRVIFEDVTLFMDVITSLQGFTFANENVKLVNTAISSYNGAVQWAILDGCSMFVSASSLIDTANFADGHYKLEVGAQPAPKSGTYPLRSIQYKTTPTSGEIGWIWGAGWVEFG